MKNSKIASRTSLNPRVLPSATHADAFGPGQAADILRILSGHAATNRTVKADCDLFSQGERGDAVYYFVDGWAVLYSLLEDGRRQILQFVLPGSALVITPGPGAPMTYSAQVLTDATVSVTPYTTLKRLARNYPEIGLQLAALIAQDRLLAYDHLTSVGRQSARERVAHLLLELFVRYRMRWPGHRIEEMHLPLTQEHIGDATGLTGVHVNRVLRDLREDGIVEFHYRRLRILNPDKLVDAAGVDPGRMCFELKASVRQESSPRRVATMNGSVLAASAL